MSTIERVKMLKTVQDGTECWEVGAELIAPLHPTILGEIKAKTGTVEILSHKDNPVLQKSKLVTPLSDDSLARAQSDLKEASEETSFEKNRAEQLEIEKRELAKSLEEFTCKLNELSTKVNGDWDSFEAFKKAFLKIIEPLPKKIADLEKRLDILLERIDSTPKVSESKQDVPPKNVRKEKASGKKKIIVRRNK